MGFFGKPPMATAPSVSPRWLEPSLTLPWVILGAFVGCLCLDLLRRALFIRRHSFHGRHVLITGGSAGIGKALAAELLARGARVSLLARTASKLEATSNELRESAVAKSAAAKSAAKSADASAPPSSAVQLQYVCADISDEAAMRAAVESASARFGPVEVLVCNAGSAAPGLFAQMPVETFERQMNVNYIGTVSFLVFLFIYFFFFREADERELHWHRELSCFFFFQMNVNYIGTVSFLVFLCFPRCPYTHSSLASLSRPKCHTFPRFFL